MTTAQQVNCMHNQPIGSGCELCREHTEDLRLKLEFEENMAKLQRSFRAGRVLERWRKIQLELFTPNLAPARRQRIQRILDRIIARYNALTPWNKINLGGAK